MILSGLWIFCGHSKHRGKCTRSWHAYICPSKACIKSMFRKKTPKLKMQPVNSQTIFGSTECLFRNCNFALQPLSSSLAQPSAEPSSVHPLVLLCHPGFYKSKLKLFSFEVLLLLLQQGHFKRNPLHPPQCSVPALTEAR